MTDAHSSLVRTGATADEDIYADRIELEDVRARFPWSNFSAVYRYARSWGYVELAGLLEWIEWVDEGADEFDLSGDALAWGLNLSSNINLGTRPSAR